MTVLLDHWEINFVENTLKNTKTNTVHTLEPRTMDVFKVLIDNHGEVISREQFFNQVWHGRNTVEESLTLCISELRQILKDNAKNPKFIKTIHKKGYKLLVKPKVPSEKKYKSALFITIAAAILILAVVFVTFIIMKQYPSAQSTAVNQNLDVMSEYEDVRNMLVKQTSNAATIKWQTGDSNNIYTIKYTALGNSVDSSTQIKLSIIDQYDFVIWDFAYAINTLAEKTAVVDYLVDVLKQLQKYKIAPEMALLPANLRLRYQQALYLIDKRGETNLNKATTLLDEIIAQQPEFIMALVNKAVAARMLGFYQPTIELRQQSNYQYQFTLKQAQAIAPTHPVVKGMSSKLNLEQWNWDEYEQILTSAVEYSPACVACVRYLAEFYLDLGYFKKAEELVIKHIDYFPLSLMMHTFLGQIYNMQADVEGAKNQVKILKSLGSDDGSDTLAMELNISLNQGDIESYQALSAAMVNKHPAYAAHKQAIDAQIAGDIDEFKRIVNAMPRLDFNLAVAVGNLESIISRVTSNVSNGNLRDLRLTHGWRSLDTHLAKSYGTNLKLLQNRREISALFDEIGLTATWSNKAQWPDYCYQETSFGKRPDYCF